MLNRHWLPRSVSDVSTWDSKCAIGGLQLHVTDDSEQGLLATGSGWQAKQAAWRHRASAAATIRSLIDVLLELEQAATRSSAPIADPASRCAMHMRVKTACTHVHHGFMSTHERVARALWNNCGQDGQAVAPRRNAGACSCTVYALESVLSMGRMPETAARHAQGVMAHSGPGPAHVPNAVRGGHRARADGSRQRPSPN